MMPCLSISADCTERPQRGEDGCPTNGERPAHSLFSKHELWISSASHSGVSGADLVTGVITDDAYDKYGPMQVPWNECARRSKRSNPRQKLGSGALRAV